MAKFSGYIGYAELVETSSGIWEEQITEHKHYGELVRNTSRLSTSQNLNDNVDITSEISIMSDTYAIKNYCSMRYIEYMGAKWKIKSVEPKYPRLILTIGGAYNEKQS